MFETFALLFSGLMIGFVAGMSPGPDTVIVMSAVSSGGARAGIRSAVGIGAGFAIHACATLAMAVGVVQFAPGTMTALQALGSSYLCYIGVTLMLSTPQGQSQQVQTVKSVRPFLNGFFTNLMNPKCLVFCTAVISPLLNSQELTHGVSLLVGVTIGVLTWFIVLSIAVASLGKRLPFHRLALANRIFGVILIGLSIAGIWAVVAN